MATCISGVSFVIKIRITKMEEGIIYKGQKCEVSGYFFFGGLGTVVENLLFEA